MKVNVSHERDQWRVIDARTGLRLVGVCRISDEDHTVELCRCAADMQQFWGDDACPNTVTVHVPKVVVDLARYTVLVNVQPPEETSEWGTETLSVIPALRKWLETAR